MRALDNLVLPADKVETESSEDEFDAALSFLDPEDAPEVEPEPAPADAAQEGQLEFNPLEPDEEIHIEDLDPEDATLAQDASVISTLLRDLEQPLARALAEAERVLGDEQRVATWVENQARRRMLALAARFADELRETEAKRSLSSPPPAD